MADTTAITIRRAVEADAPALGRMGALLMRAVPPPRCSMPRLSG
jgi:hypothetical protein